MALKNVRPSAAGGRHVARYVTRTEAKDGARQVRRDEDRSAEHAEDNCSCSSSDGPCPFYANSSHARSTGWSNR